MAPQTFFTPTEVLLPDPRNLYLTLRHEIALATRIPNMSASFVSVLKAFRMAPTTLLFVGLSVRRR
eukprot:3927119-Alexandrium_andersonii.AAC.1